MTTVDLGTANAANSRMMFAALAFTQAVNKGTEPLVLERLLEDYRTARVTYEELWGDQ